MSKYQRRDMGFWYHREYDPVRNGSMDGTDVYAHDHGLVRASQYDSRRTSDFKGDPYKTIFVGRLNPLTTEETIHRTFSRYGKIHSLHLVRDMITGCSKGYAFVEYVHEEDFVSAFFGGHRIHLDDSQILVDFMREETVPGWKPRRLGGGVGGRKQSGQMRFGGRDCPFRAPFDINIYRSRTNASPSSNPNAKMDRNDRGYDNENGNTNGNGNGSRNGSRNNENTNTDNRERKDQRYQRDYYRDRNRDHRSESQSHSSTPTISSEVSSTPDQSSRRKEDQPRRDYKKEESTSSSRRYHDHDYDHRSRSRSRSRRYDRDRDRDRDKYHHSHHHSHSHHHHSHSHH